MTDTDKLPPLPLRQIGTSLTDEDLDRLDLFRRAMLDLPSRSAILRDALRFYLDMQESPHLMIAGLLDGLEAIYSDQADDSVCQSDET